MNEHELLERYEALGDEADFLAAKPLFEQALAEAPDSSVLRRDYGYLLECHARNELRRAVAEYARAIDLDPRADKARYQLNSAYAGLREQERAIAFCKQRLDASPGDVREYRVLASAYLLAATSTGPRLSSPPGSRSSPVTGC
jgi:tetratricopeptide (TPR) repeat protein